MAAFGVRIKPEPRPVPFVLPDLRGRFIVERKPTNVIGGLAFSQMPDGSLYAWGASGTRT